VEVERAREGGKVERRSYPSLAIALRKELGLYMNVRPVKNYPNVPSRYDRHVDLVIFRENSEDLYIGNERMVDENTAEAIKRITRGARARRALRFEYMRRTGRKKMTIGHKANVMKMTDGLFLKAAQDVARDYPDIELDQRVVDALCMELVIRPETSTDCCSPTSMATSCPIWPRGWWAGSGSRPGANIGPDVRDVRGGARHRAGHRGQGHRQSDRDDPVRRADAALYRRSDGGRPHRAALMRSAGREAHDHARPRRHGGHPGIRRRDRRAACS
jgi:hypothetical protein